MQRGTLRRRIVWTYTGLTAAICLLFALLAYVTMHEVEDRLVYRRLDALADRLIEDHRRGRPPDAAQHVRLVQGGRVPDAFAGLPPGIHDDKQDGRDVHVLVRIDGGERFVLIDEEPDFWAIEEHVAMALAAGALAALLFGVALARLMVNRVVAPLTELARAVETRAPLLPSLDAGDEIGTLARAFAERTATLENYLARERSFTGDVSHELRTPLTVISGAAELLGAHAVKQPGLAPLAQRIARAAADASERVNALLLLARTGQQADLRPTELAPIVQREAERCRGLLAAKPVVLNVRIEHPVRAVARPELVGILVGNLLRNACQYTSRGAITVTLTPEALTLDDTGPGLPAPVRAKLLEPSLPAEQADAGGNGLGLSIVRRIAEHLGWVLAVEDRRGGGTRFTLGIPQLGPA